MKKLYRKIRPVILWSLLCMLGTSGYAQIKHTQVWKVASGNDDAEECVPGGSGTPGSMDLTSSDLEIMVDGSKRQMIGLRFTNIDIPQGAIIERAYVQFTTKGDKAAISGAAYITAEDTDDALMFSSSSFNISSRPQVSDSVTWSGTTSSSWGTSAGGTAGTNQRTPDIKNIIQPVINRVGWNPGNALVIIMKGSGVRNAYSYNGSSGNDSYKPTLIVEYTAASVPAPYAVPFPFAKENIWRFLDDGTDQGTAWKDPTFIDTSWHIGTGKLGYSDNAVTTLSYGPSASNKYITYYFRKQFAVTDTSLLDDTIQVNLLRDDGAIIYINGTEVVKNNLPASGVDYLTWATNTVDGAEESTYLPFKVPKNVLVNGTNTIAVEVHQRDGTSSDLGFDLSLTTYTPPPPPPVMQVIPFPIPTNSVWKYLDDGTDQGTAWTAVVFNDTAWSFGPGKLGYSDNPATVLSYGPSSSNKYITYYFRKPFTVADVSLLEDSLDIHILRDDGAVIYINGTEVARTNMPAGPIDYLTWAPTIVDGAAESIYYLYRVPTSVLVNGLNVIAAEVHQRDGTSSDLGFDLSLTEYTPATMTVINFPVPANSLWRYLDNGTDQGTAWTAPTFVDTTWDFGPGKLGYSDNPVTTLSYGSDPANKYITYYFRKQFNVTDTALLADTLRINLLRDDAAAVYINGTEVARDNLPTGAINYLTWATNIVDGTDESVYFPFLIPKTVLINGVNTLAVEVHQRDGTSSDLGFDLSLEEYYPPVICNPLPPLHISDFVSVMPSAQPDTLRIPSTHTFQMLLQSGDPYTDPAHGVTKSTFDFTGYVPINGSSTNGYLSVNHEEGSWPSAGVSMLSLNYDAGVQLWNVTNNVPVDFSVVFGTGRNCSGTVTPWNTIITCEETLPSADANGDGYIDVGWAVEIDPATHSVMDHDYDGQPDKLWRLGRMSHENVVVATNMKTVYEGNDENPGYIFRMIADTATRLGTGNLYVLKLDGAIGAATTGIWIQVPNSTPAECNNVRAAAAAVGATNFDSVEDVEISPKDNKIYFTSKASSRVYRFLDNGNTVSQFEIFVGNASTQYAINYGTATVNEQWRSGNDNLTFDNEGNLYVIQDGGRNHIWMVRPCHTAANPMVELFAVTPAGCEPTGMTLSPDNKFMFVSMQHPSSGNNTQMIDAAGNPVKFNKESAIVIARKEFLGSGTPLNITFSSFNAYRTAKNEAALEWSWVAATTMLQFGIQRMVAGGSFETIAVVDQAAVEGRQGTYFHTDANPYAGKNFYRIKAIDRSGKEVYTNIRVVDIPLNGRLAIVNAYPNPTSGDLHLTLASPGTAKADVLLLDITGSRVWQQQVSLIEGNNPITLHIAALSAGVYHVQVTSEGYVLKTRIVKK